jgi:hypothetical protein
MPNFADAMAISAIARSRRDVLGMGAAVLLGQRLITSAHAQDSNVSDVRAFGAAGDGKTLDIAAVRAAALQLKKAGGGRLFFPAGEYFLGEPPEGGELIAFVDLDNVTVSGYGARLVCQSRRGTSNIIKMNDCRNVLVEGLTFVDLGLNRQSATLGAVALSFGANTAAGSRRIAVRDCTFIAVLAAIQCRAGKGRVREVTLDRLKVSDSFYGFSFVNNGDAVRARALVCSNVCRSYFPYGVSNHDIDIDTEANATGFTDILIKCYTLPTTDLRVKFSSRGKRTGNAIVELADQHESGAGLIRNITLEGTVSDTDCKLLSVLRFVSYTPSGAILAETSARWENVQIRGAMRACADVPLLKLESIPRPPLSLSIDKELLSQVKNLKLPGAVSIVPLPATGLLRPL